MDNTIKITGPELSNVQSSFADELDDILKNIDPDILGETEIIDLKKKINPYGRLIEGSNKYVTFSLTNFKEKYLKRFLTTALIGYLNRACDEWRVPDGIDVISVYEYLENPDLLNPPEISIKNNDKKVLQSFEFNKKMMEKRIIVKAFLEEMFEFNPDKHVRSSYIPPTSSKSSRKKIVSDDADLAYNFLLQTDPVFAEADKMFKLENSETPTEIKKPSSKHPSKSSKLSKSVDQKTYIQNSAFDDIQQIYKELGTTIKDHKTDNEIINEIIRVKNSNDPNCEYSCINMIPPQDFYGKFGVYTQANYETLRKVTDNIYAEKSEFEWAINVYNIHNSEEEARQYVMKHRNEVIADINIATTGAWVFMGDFKQNRDKIALCNDKAIVINEMMRQHELDEQLSRELVNKRIKTQKEKNVKEVGPDSEIINKWKKSHDLYNKYGIPLNEEIEKNPDIEINVWKVNKNVVTQENIYIEAEAPEFADKSIMEGKKEDILNMAPGLLNQ